MGSGCQSCLALAHPWWYGGALAWPWRTLPHGKALRDGYMRRHGRGLSGKADLERRMPGDENDKAIELGEIRRLQALEGSIDVGGARQSAIFQLDHLDQLEAAVRCELRNVFRLGLDVSGVCMPSPVRHAEGKGESGAN